MKNKLKYCTWLVAVFIFLFSTGIAAQSLDSRNGNMTLKNPVNSSAEAISYSITDGFNEDEIPLRRPISITSPTWIIHIDVWADADPKKIIELVPEDIRPFVIFNISLSVSDPGSGPYGTDVDTYSIIESWLRTCAEYRVWTTVQTASGYKQALPNTHTANDIYEYYYKNYPNFIGINFSEQCWGFPTESDFDQRLTLFSDLIKLGHKYGGYVFVSHAQTMNTPQNNAVASLKRNASFREACQKYPQNYVTLEKYTTSRGFYDVESTTLGAYLAGYAGNYGIRFDNCGWNYIDTRATKKFPEILGVVPIVEHALFTGQTVSDGPELTWSQMVIRKNGTETSSDGYTSKRFTQFPNFTNNNLDVFRKILDSSFPIPSKAEVIARTRVSYVNDAVTGDNRNKYSSQQSLFTGLYALDGEYDDNNAWTKQSGRYPTIPTIFKEGETETGTFQHVVKKSNYSATWPSIQAKVDYFNALFPQEYTGNIYAGRINNIWLTYNPYMGEADYTQLDVRASGSIPFKYNTCEKMEISHSNYSMAVIKETGNKLAVYLNNFCSELSDGIPLERKDTIKIYGSTNKPTYTYQNRGDSRTISASISELWTNGVYTLSVSHNGPLDLTINCAGNHTEIASIPAAPAIIQPAAPPIYTGILQQEAEDLEYKNISSAKTNNGLPGYTALGYAVFGAKSSAAMRTNIAVAEAGYYLIKTKYSVSSSVSNIDLYVNGRKAATPEFSTTAGWAENVHTIYLDQGSNKIELRANAGGANDMSIDNIIIERTESPYPQNITDIQTLTYYTHTGATVNDVMVTTPITTKLTAKTNVTDNTPIIGEANFVQRKPGKFFDLREYATLKVAIHTPETAAGTTANLRCFFIAADWNDRAGDISSPGNYETYNHLEPVTFTGGEQIITVDLQLSTIAAKPYLSFVRFVDMSEAADFSADIDYVGVSSQTTSIKPVHKDDDNNKIVDVYNLSGILIRKGMPRSEAAKGLKTGFYIVGREKVFIMQQ